MLWIIILNFLKSLGIGSSKPELETNEISWFLKNQKQKILPNNMIASITPNPIAPAWLKRWVPVPKVVESSTLWVKRNMIIAMKAMITASLIKFEKESLDLF